MFTYNLNSIRRWMQIMKTIISLCNIIQINLLYFSEFALHVFDSIMEAGKDFGIRHCGYYAMHAVRIEKVRCYVLLFWFILFKCKYIKLNAFIYWSMHYNFLVLCLLGLRFGQSIYSLRMWTSIQSKNGRQK